MTNTVLIYVDTSKQVGDKDHLKVFANEDAAETWLQENDPEGVAFEYEVLDYLRTFSRWMKGARCRLSSGPSTTGYGWP